MLIIYIYVLYIIHIYIINIVCYIYKQERNLTKKCAKTCQNNKPKYTIAVIKFFTNTYM